MNEYGQNCKVDISVFVFTSGPSLVREWNGFRRQAPTLCLLAACFPPNTPTSKALSPTSHQLSSLLTTVGVDIFHPPLSISLLGAPAQCRENAAWPGLVCCPRLELSAPNGGLIVRPRPATAAAVRQPLQQQQAVESCGRAAAAAALGARRL